MNEGIQILTNFGNKMHVSKNVIEWINLITLTNFFFFFFFFFGMLIPYRLFKQKCWLRVICDFRFLKFSLQTAIIYLFCV